MWSNDFFKVNVTIFLASIGVSPEAFLIAIPINQLEVEAVKGGMENLDKVIRPFLANDRRSDSPL